MMFARLICTLVAAATLATTTNVGATVILAGWNDDDFAVDVTEVTGVTGTLTEGFGTSPGSGSNDGTYGLDTTTSPAPAGNGSITIRSRSGASARRLTVAVTNNSGADVTLASFNFDYSRTGTNSLRDVAGTYIGATNSLGETNVALGSANNVAVVGSGEQDYHDFSFDLASLLSDVVLSDGQTATFRITASDIPGGNFGNISNVDNIAVTATVSATIPEPSTLLLSGMGILGLAACRRRARNRA